MTAIVTAFIYIFLILALFLIIDIIVTLLRGIFLDTYSKGPNDIDFVNIDKWNKESNIPHHPVRTTIYYGKGHLSIK